MADAVEVETMEVDKSEDNLVAGKDESEKTETEAENDSQDNTNNDVEMCEEIKNTESEEKVSKPSIKAKKAENNQSVLESELRKSLTVDSDTKGDETLENSDKQSAEDPELSVVKPNSIPDRLTDSSSKNSPESILADDGLVDRASSDFSSSKPTKNDASENQTKVASEETKETVDKEEKDSKSKHESKSGSKKEKKKGKLCAECGEKKKLELRIVFQGKAYHLCSEFCYKNFKEKKSTPKPIESTEENCSFCEKKITNGPGFFSTVGDIKPLCSEECLRKYHEKHGVPKKCGQCKKQIESVYNQLTWETMVFCNEDCLGSYQSFLGSHCTCCQSPVQQTSLGKYCVCFGADIRQFCSGSCLEEFKKGLKVCSFCQTDLSSIGGDGFLAPVGDKGQFKDFCSQMCMERYETMNNNSKSTPEANECSFCKKQGSFKTQVKHGSKSFALCCELCLAGFRCSYKIQDNMCNTCFKFFKSEDEGFSFKHDGTAKHFCTKACMTLYVLSHRKIIQCVQCKVKKYTFDMIEKLDCNNQTLVFCSLNCLTLHRVSSQPNPYKQGRCDNCNKNVPSQYHLTMSDGSIRNFCMYQCVLSYQTRYPNGDARPTNLLKPGVKTTSTGSNPVIANVISLSQPRTMLPTQTKSPGSLVNVRQQGPLPAGSPKTQVSSSTVTSTSLSIASPTPGTPQREIIVRPPAPKSVKNKSASCKPIMQTKGVNAKLQTCHKAVQTDERPMPIILPIPIPIYVPTPMHMFSRPVPCPVPFPVPIPVPILVESAKAFKNRQDSLPMVPNNSHDTISKPQDIPLDTGSVKLMQVISNDVNNIQKEVSHTLSSPEKKSLNSTVLDDSGVHIEKSTKPKIILKTEPEDDYPLLESKQNNKRAAVEQNPEAKRSRLDSSKNHEHSQDEDVEMINFRVGDTNKLEVS